MRRRLRLNDACVRWLEGGESAPMPRRDLLTIGRPRAGGRPGGGGVSWRWCGGSRDTRGPTRRLAAFGEAHRGRLAERAPRARLGLAQGDKRNRRGGLQELARSLCEVEREAEGRKGGGPRRPRALRAMARKVADGTRQIGRISRGDPTMAATRGARPFYAARTSGVNLALRLWCAGSDRLLRSPYVTARSISGRPRRRAKSERRRQGPEAARRRGSVQRYRRDRRCVG